MIRGKTCYYFFTNGSRKDLQDFINLKAKQ